MANASMPVGMQHGQFPYERFTECDLPGATAMSDISACQYTFTNATSHTLLTVPSDRIFVVTGAVNYRGYCNFHSNGKPLIGKLLIYGYDGYSGQSPIGNGNGHLVLEPGSSLEVYP